MEWFSLQAWGLAVEILNRTAPIMSSPHKCGGWPWLYGVSGTLKSVFPTIVGAQTTKKELAYEH